MLTLQISLSAIARDSVEGKLWKLNIHARHHSLITAGSWCWPSESLTVWCCCPVSLQPKRKSLRPTGRLTAGSLMTILKSLLSFMNQRTPSISNTHTHKHRCTHAYGYGNACISTKHKYTQAFESRKQNGHWRTSFTSVSQRQGWSRCDEER